MQCFVIVVFVQGLLDGDIAETVPSCIVSEVYISLLLHGVKTLAQVTVEETNVESMDTADAEDNEIINLIAKTLPLSFGKHIITKAI